MIGLREDTNAREPADTAALAESIFSDGGWLTSHLGLEHRPQQEVMARAVERAQVEDLPLLFEAGTGVGKSLAYLVPAIIHAVETGRPCIVSTHTISLQEQIQNNDLPMCRRLFETDDALKPYAGFRSSLLVGMRNYLCPNRLAQAIGNQADLFPGREQEELLRISEWARTTTRGLVQELSPPPMPDVWEWVNAEGSGCSRKHCSPDHCHYQRARAEMRRSQIVIVNHSLLFALLNIGGFVPGDRGILLPDDFVVIDEAHTMPEVATQHFGLRLSSYGLGRQLKMVFNPRRRTGLLKRMGHDRDRQRVVDAIEAAAEFFGFVQDRVLQRQSIVRIREEGWIEPTLDAPLRAVIDSLEMVAAKLEDGPARENLLDHKGRLTTYRDGIRRFISLAAEDHVHWVERGGRKGQISTLQTAPVDIAPHLRAAVFRRKTSVILTSATLAVAGRIEPFQKRIGAEDEAYELAASPFDYSRHLRIYVAADMPLPAPDTARLALDRLVDYLRFCTLRVEGGTLVLFTSYADLRRASEALETDYRENERPLFVQGRDLSRTEITRRFQACGNGVLFGTDSFWTGVDVPGPSLSQVIVTRLPFEVPTHPIAEARGEWIRSQGGNPFTEMNLPDALIKFRQGIGRLIRNKTDCGVVTVLDSRILYKSYGRHFLASLPIPEFERLTCENRDHEFRPFN
ncbi:MAG: ATP-dependent DNA helicase [Verrucomicrobia bacterium]|nr:MAG: ATP-dependent DNA helicase [Verrucomicrobiota bacterium]